ncbi:Rho-binding antiterminator [Nannocystis exedens]|uniref:Rho-binding antiterminator n=1 Tax=Nannocystis exedens TaxID=54 RepID=A0A1I2F605_9BACT|nr:hypothetical protein [Nannocystis exedens]PCC73089.1 hypothetical protein NAEX_06175 [Nannocystis exedens]SFF00399.1 Rho-binding antiterminator [Nannocystis exedens]
MEQTEPTGRCDFLDVLEESAHFKRPVQVELRSGESFQAQVLDVVTESGEDFVLFPDRERIPVTQIVRCRSTFDHDPHSYDEKL